MAELSAQGPVAHAIATSVAIGTSPPPYAVGTRATDAAGNIYVFCTFGNAVYPELPVAISSAYNATALGTTGRGAVGIVQCVGLSTESGWVQIYGRAIVQLGMGGVSPSDDANGPTTLETVAGQNFFVLATSQSTPIGVGWVSGEAGLTSNYDYVIRGMFVAHDASPSNDVSSTTSDASHTGSHVAVWLNFPYIQMFDYVSTS